MKVETIEAKSQGKVVATADVNIPESIEEAVDMLGADKALNLLVQQYKIKELNRIRNEATQGIRIPKAIKDKLLEMDDSTRAQVAQLLGISDEALASLAAE